MDHLNEILTHRLQYQSKITYLHQLMNPTFYGVFLLFELYFQLLLRWCNYCSIPTLVTKGLKQSRSHLKLLLYYFSCQLFLQLVHYFLLILLPHFLLPLRSLPPQNYLTTNRHFRTTHSKPLQQSQFHLFSFHQLSRSSTLQLFSLIYGRFPNNLSTVPRCLALALHVPVIFIVLPLNF